MTSGVVTSPAFLKVAMTQRGGTVGGQIGYRWQAASWVFGLEAQGNWADLQWVSNCPACRRSA